MEMAKKVAIWAIIILVALVVVKLARFLLPLVIIGAIVWYFRAPFMKFVEKIKNGNL
jgi:predicted PurR-regulated permease PerM